MMSRRRFIVVCPRTWNFGTPSTYRLHKFHPDKPEGKRALGRPRRRWIDNINMDLSERGLGVVNWIGQAQDRYR
jgi:hypothetical protein